MAPSGNQVDSASKDVPVVKDSLSGMLARLQDSITAMAGDQREVKRLIKNLEIKSKDASNVESLAATPASNLTHQPYPFVPPTSLYV
jgi:hypothetical protein